jgi:hypothetical protein
MSPTIMREGGYRFFFNSREETRRHVHVATSDAVAKFWLEPTVELDSHYNMRSTDLTRIRELVERHANEFKEAWDRHFSQ